MASAVSISAEISLSAWVGKGTFDASPADLRHERLAHGSKRELVVATTRAQTFCPAGAA